MDKYKAVASAYWAVHSTLKGKVKRSKLLGCTHEELIAHLEGQFQKGWTWKNYGKTWEIDHILPLREAYDQGEETFRKAMHYTNLRPLALSENRAGKKGKCPKGKPKPSANPGWFLKMQCPTCQQTFNSTRRKNLNDPRCRPCIHKERMQRYHREGKTWYHRKKAQQHEAALSNNTNPSNTSSSPSLSSSNGT